MRENAIEIKRTVETTNHNQEILLLRQWFTTEYRDKLDMINRDKYLGLPVRLSRYALEMEAYEKENRLRELEGKNPLPAPKFTNII